MGPYFPCSRSSVDFGIATARGLISIQCSSVSVGQRLLGRPTSKQDGDRGSSGIELRTSCNLSRPEGEPSMRDATRWAANETVGHERKERGGHEELEKVDPVLHPDLVDRID